MYYRTGNASKATLLYGKNDATDGRISGVHHALKRRAYGMLVGLTEIVKRKENEMSKKLMGFASRKVAAFLAGLVVGIVVGGCSVFGPGIGASVY